MATAVVFTVLSALATLVYGVLTTTLPERKTARRFALGSLFIIAFCGIAIALYGMDDTRQRIETAVKLADSQREAFALRRQVDVLMEERRLSEERRAAYAERLLQDLRDYSVVPINLSGSKQD